MSDIVQIATGCALLASVTIALIVAPRLWWVFFATMIWASTFSFGAVDISKLQEQEWSEAAQLAPAIRRISDYSRPVCGIILVALTVSGLTQQRGWRNKRIVSAAIFLIALEWYYSLRMLLGESIGARPIFAAITFLLLAVHFAVVLPNRTQSTADFHRTVYAIALAGVFFVVGVYVQMLFDSRALYDNQGRMRGTTYNANHGGHTCAAFLIPMIWLAFNGGFKKHLSLVCMALSAILAFWVLKSGSRGAMIATVVGLVLTLRTHRKTLLWALPSLAAVYLLVAQFNQDVLVDTSRATTALDTRSAAWKMAFAQWQASPIWGYCSGETFFVENSYISAACAFGIVGLVLIVAFTVTAAAAGWRLKQDFAHSANAATCQRRGRRGRDDFDDWRVREFPARHLHRLGLFAVYVFTQMAFLQDWLAQRAAARRLDSREAIARAALWSPGVPATGSAAGLAP